MIAVFLYTSCYDVTVLHVTLLLKHFNKLLFTLFEKPFMFYGVYEGVLFLIVFLRPLGVKIIRVTL